ncbi:MAG: hypothetical protein DRO73_04515 [Candidatus Thorarchaeota archaeon]|nr:MAG: hypothetical protein DRO73_04515 [Candidatus Thorarchaeota archaeon]
MVEWLTMRTITLSEDTYNLLRKMRLPGETFSDTIARLCRAKTARGVLEWMRRTRGWSDLTNEEAVELEAAIERNQDSGGGAGSS